MTRTDALDRALALLPLAYPGPGGAAAVLHEGQVVARHAWGWANAERRIPFTPATLFRVCSITKQFTCAAMLAALPVLLTDPTVLDAAIRARMPLLEGPAPGALHLAHNQSGLRDYWAEAMLHGAPAESAFGDAETARLIGGTRTLQFVPGTRYSYVNQNFRLLSDALAERTGRGFAELLRSLVFAPAGMDSAVLAADTRAMPDGTEGYEGTPVSGFRAAENRVLWTGDAGVGASLDDMIAWERHIDATWDDPASLYQRLCAPVTFGDGTPAPYGFGLGRRPVLGRAATQHGGALRGWRSHRVVLAGARLSVVVLFNHMADAQAAAHDLVAAALGEAPAPARTPDVQDWLGAYLEPETGLAVRLDEMGGGRTRLRFAQSGELLSEGGGTRLRPEPDGLWMDRPGENQSSRLLPLHGPAGRDIEGRYRCEELAAELTVVDTGGVMTGGFSGALGLGRMETLEPVGPDVWMLPCPRALDHAPPGDWTLAFRREGGAVAGVTVGCWLARGLRYEKI